MGVAIVTDSCHYLTSELLAKNDIHQVSLYVHWHDDTQKETEIVDLDAYYERLGTSPDLPTTSQPSIGDFLEVYEPILAAGDDIVSIHLAGGMSGTVHSAEQARERLGARAERVHVIDSASACGGQGLVVLAAAAAARAGADAPAVAERTRRARAQLKLWFAIDTLEYLRRGGRIAGAQAWLGSALKIKPILTVESEITPVERVRTSRRAFERMVELLRSCKEAGADAWMIQHIQAPKEANDLVARGLEIFGCEPVMVAEIGPVIGTHVGPGLLGAGGIPSSFL
ncbi:MAG: fatty acid kinase fatty acid binding subunit [Solirubrobacteraceae bacterium]|jgi:DegV family protein with EDD domain|nr:fatty acid kinase fatty acid binding subunit [Solirubrobacteraceae bacterium]